MIRNRPLRRDRRPGHRPARAALVLALALGTGVSGPPAAAREGDRQQPATIEADRAEIERPAGIARYYGDVVFVQGTLRITGATVVVEAPGGRVQRATADAGGGDPATVRQETDAGRMVRAHAQRIVYDATIPRVDLEGAAELLRGGERFAAGRIRYWPDTGRVEAGRGEDGERVRIRIEPQNGGDRESGDGE